MQVFEWILNPYSLPFWLLVLALIGIALAIVFRPSFTYMRFVYPNAKFEAIGNPFITDKEVNRLLESKDLAFFRESLNTSKDFKVIGDDIASVQNSLEAHFIQTVKMMRKDSSKKLHKFYDIYLEKNDMFLIKNELKKILLGQKIDINAERAILPHTKELLHTISVASKETLPQILLSYGFEKELAEAIQTQPPDLLMIDILIDKYIIKNLSEVKLPYKCERAKKQFVQRIIDIMNMKHLLRAKQLEYDSQTCLKLFLGTGLEISLWRFQEMAEATQIPDVISALDGTSYFPPLNDVMNSYNTDGSVQVFENALDRHFLKIIKNISLQNYISLGPTLRFLVSKEFEIQNLKVIAKGIGEQLPAEFIRRFIITEVGS